MLVVERWILARLRNRRFFSLAKLNKAIAELLMGGRSRPGLCAWSRFCLSCKGATPVRGLMF